jgi:hypothetical protein
VNGALRLVTMFFLIVAFFGILAHPNFLSSSTNAVTSITRQVQAG